MSCNWCGILVVIITIFINSSGTTFEGHHPRTKPIKVLMVVPIFPKISDVCMLNQITGLIDLGYDVYIYAKKRNKFFKIQEDVKKYDLVNKTFYGKLPKNLNRFDIVVFQLGHKAFNIKRKLGFKGKLVICLRGYDMSGYITKKPKAYDQLFSVCDLFLPVCDLFKERLINLGADSNKIVVIHSAINCSRFKYKKRYSPKLNCKLKVVSAGRFVEKKGFEYAIRAIAYLVKEYPNIRYTIFGGGPLEERLKTLVKTLNMSKYIKIRSWQTHKELVRILDNSHIFIAPSVTAENGDQEGIPNVLKEAMAMGLLVISTNHGGIPELIENHISGLLVPERSVVALSRCIKYLITHPKIWVRIGKSARDKIIKEFNQDEEKNKLAKIFKKYF